MSMSTSTLRTNAIDAVNTQTSTFSADVLTLDAPTEIARIAANIRDVVTRRLRRKGVVVGISGGIDSSVVAALAVKALGADRVLGLLLPESESSPESLELGTMLAASLGIQTVLEDITPILDGARCYARRDDAIRTVVPEYGPAHKCKIVLPSILDGDGYRIFSLVVQAPNGERRTANLTAEAYLGILSAMNFKQRVRKMMEYYHADRLQYAVAGTPNRLEYDQGFFVKLGDGAADLKPIAHLYKSQVYQLAETLAIPVQIRSRAPTTDTYTLAQTQEEFFFSVPYATLDLCLYAKNHGIDTALVAAATGLTNDQVERIDRDIDAKRRATRYLHEPAQLVDPVREIDG